MTAIAQRSFLWHDYETFGANVRQDRPAEFACWRTNENFEPVAEPLTIRCQPTLDYLPDPVACAITGIGPETAYREGCSEPEFALQVSAEMGTAQTCVVGYNSMRFDDEITRSLFWRNFIDPYEREWARGNSRYDLIDLARAAQALRPSGVIWPSRDDGHPSFKLSDLSTANALPHRHAHAALSDVEATLALARLLHTAQPKLLSFGLGLRHKARVMEWLDWRQRLPIIHVSQRFPAERGCLAQVIPVAMHPSQNGKIIVVDAAHDPEALLTWPAEDLARMLLTPASDPHRIALGLKLVHANRSPFLAPLSVLEGVDLKRIRFDADAIERHTALLRAADGLDRKLQQVYKLLDSQIRAPQDADAALYEGFVADSDRSLCRRWHNAQPDQLVELSKKFADPRLQTLAFRYRARHHENTLDPTEQQLWLNHCRERLNNPERPIDQYLNGIREIGMKTPALAADLELWGKRIYTNAQMNWLDASVPKSATADKL